jgi:hypothetical protein
VQARYGVSAPTLRRYIRAYQSGNEEGLRDHRQGPHRPPGKTPKTIEDQILAARGRAPFMGGSRLVANYQLPVSGNTANRILREHGKLARPPKVREKRKDMRAVKALLKSFHKLEADIKYLTDIPNLAVGIKLWNFPKYQYTVRDVKSGMVFLGYSNEISQLNARTMIRLVLHTLRLAGIDTCQIVVQTDSGVEFGGPKSWNNAFTTGVTAFNARHIKIPPKQPNFNADVESYHNTCEVELFNHLEATSRCEFLKGVEAYRRWYNSTRPISTKGFKPPALIIDQDYPNSDTSCIAICQLPVVDLDAVAGLPTSSKKGKTIPCLTEYPRGSAFKKFLLEGKGVEDELSQSTA